MVLLPSCGVWRGEHPLLTVFFITSHIEVESKGKGTLCDIFSKWHTSNLVLAILYISSTYLSKRNPGCCGILESQCDFSVPQIVTNLMKTTKWWSQVSWRKQKLCLDLQQWQKTRTQQLQQKSCHSTLNKYSVKLGYY